jgi:hypothetical protein
MGGGAWSNDQPRTLTIPAGAGPTDAATVIGPDVPAELVAYYVTGSPTTQTAPETVIGGILYRNGNGDYGYDMLIRDSSAAKRTSLVRGNYNKFANKVTETYRYRLDNSPGFPTFIEDSVLILTGTHFGSVRNVECMRVTDSGVTNYYWHILADGTQEWGAGTGNPDTMLYRYGAAELAVDNLKWNFNGGLAEVWNTLTLANNFTNRGGLFPALAYRRVPSPAYSVQIVGQIVSGVTVASGTQIATLPVGYRPISEWTIPINGNSQALILVIGTDGSIKIFGTWVNGSIIQINGLFSMDY